VGSNPSTRDRRTRVRFWRYLLFKLIVAGSRSFCDYELLNYKLTFLLKNKTRNDVEIVSGGAKGADSLGEKFAKEKGYNVRVFRADWKKYGRKAGLIRNVEMGKYADALVAFWDGISTGTAHMIDFANKNNLIVRVIYF
jgi:hypothetical protein